MSEREIGSVVQLLLLLLASAHLLGCLFVRLRQPRVIGEILAGLLLGPSVFGKLAPELSQRLLAGGMDSPGEQASILHFVYWLGLLLLMFVSGVESRQLFGRRDQARIAILAVFGTVLPFLLVLAVSPLLPLDAILGRSDQRVPALLVVGIAIAVTSIPVISRMFHDLGILHTRFASLVLGVAVLEDVALWVVLALATALATSSAVVNSVLAAHLAVTIIYFGAGLLAGPPVLRRLSAARWNVLATSSPAGWALIVLLTYTAVAASLGVSLVFAAFLAGFGLCSQDEKRQALSVEAISKFSFSLFIPAYFAIVGFRIDFGSTFSFASTAVFIVAACGIKLLAVALGARIAGFNRLDTLNLAVVTNARGGPGIVLASVAFDAGIINAAFYTTLILLAVLTSQAAGAWLEHVLRRGWPLLSGEPATAPATGSGDMVGKVA
jgi:Kef-type K+ transport system membrane component KefB